MRRALRNSTLALACAVLMQPVFAQVYVAQGAQGEPCFSDAPDGAAWSVFIDDDRVPAPPAAAVAAAAPSAVRAYVDAAAQRHGVSAALLHAVIATESGYRARAVSPRGAMGLMQLMPATARALGVDDAFDPQRNIDAGARHLRGLIDRYRGDWRLALAAYNAGAGTVDRYGRAVPPYRETVDYLARVQAHLRVDDPAGMAR